MLGLDFTEAPVGVLAGVEKAALDCGGAEACEVCGAAAPGARRTATSKRSAANLASNSKC